MKDININNFKVTEHVQLKNIPTKFDLEASKKSVEKELEDV